MPYQPRFSLILSAAAVALLVGCSHLTKSWVTPGVTLISIRPVQMSVDQQTVIVSLNVNNPNDRALPIRGATYKLEVEGIEVGSGASSLDKQIPAFDEGVVDVSVNTNLAGLIASLPPSKFSGEKWSYEVSGVLDLAVGYIPAVPYRYSGEVEAGLIISRLLR